MNNHFSGAVTVFHGMKLPVEAIPAGYSALIDAFNLHAPFPYQLAAIGLKHNVIIKDNWHILTPRHTPESTVFGHLQFALKHEGVDLCVLKKLFEALNSDEVADMFRRTPTGIYSRRLWFLYEWLTKKQLDLPDMNKGNYIDVLDSKQQFTVAGHKSQRHRVVNNLPGTPDFCPLIFNNLQIQGYLGMNLKEKALKTCAEIPIDVIGRAAAFLLLKDSKASFAIENESAPHKRIERWSRIIGEAGKTPVDTDELIRLQEIVIGDSRFVGKGFRTEGGFVGEHDRTTGTPLPEHVSACSEDIDTLINGLIKYNEIIKGEIDPVAIAAAVSFGFIYIHPFSDGNGRLHRYLIHHILAENGYNPSGLIFPVSAAMLDRIESYEKVLSGYSSRILPFIEWEQTSDHNVRVLNDTADYYRYFDATPHAQFLYYCVMKTIEEDLPDEAEFLVKYDRFRDSIQDIVEMPDRLVNLLYIFLSQNNGKLSKRAQEKEFAPLTSEEVRQFEDEYHNVFKN